MTTTLRWLPGGVEALERSPGVAERLGAIAEKVRARVRLPGTHFRLRTRHGVGKRGAFAQVRMAGKGALAVEYGTRKRRPQAPLRRALKGRV